MQTSTEAHAAPRRGSRIRAADRDFNAPGLHHSPMPPADIAARLTRRERQILQMLLGVIGSDGGTDSLNRATLRTSGPKMQELYWNGWVNGAGSRDEHGTGNTPQSSWWWLTTYGERIAREIKEGVRT